MAPRLTASWYDGISAQARDCELDWQPGELLLLSPGAAPRRYAAGRVVWPERTRHGQRQLLLPDGGVVALADARAWDDWADAAGLAQPLAARWAMNWRAAALALLLVAALGGAWRWGIPWGAQALSAYVPARLQAELGLRVLRDLEQRGWLKPSALPGETQQRIIAAVAAMALKAYEGDTLPAYRLNFRQAPKWLGPNAFALPGGDIVVTDALVSLLQGPGDEVSPALLGVLAHEIGHVRERHGLRMVFEAGAVSVLMGWWIGDYSAVLAGAPALALQAGYSRDHERAADAEALRIMRAAGIDPMAMVRFFDALQKTLPERDGEKTSFGLATHPVDSERRRFFQQGVEQGAR
jgi:Zn-dependent protease with chaperone function